MTLNNASIKALVSAVVIGAVQAGCSGRHEPWQPTDSATALAQRIEAATHQAEEVE